MSKKFLTEFLTEDEFQKFLYYMPNPDITYQNTGETIKIIEEMKTDPHIFAKLEELKAKILSKNWSIVPASQSAENIKIADFVRNVIEVNIDLNNDLSELLTALEYGFSVTEIVWKIENGYFIPDSLKGRSQSRFAFNGKNQLIDLSNMTILDMPNKFMVFRSSIINENPYGQSILTRCYWSWKFKKAGLQYWITLLDKFSVPSIAALFKTEYPDDAKLREMGKLISEELAKIDSGSSAAFGNVDDIKILETSGQGDSYERLINLCNNEISKAITGSTLTSDTQVNGNRSLGETHLDTLETRANKTNKKLEDCFNRTLIKWIVELNFGVNIAPPRFQFDLTEIPPWEIIKDSIDRGIPVSVGALYNMYGIPKPDDNNPEDAFVKSVSQPQLPMNFSDFFFQTKDRKRFNLK